MNTNVITNEKNVVVKTIEKKVLNVNEILQIGNALLKQNNGNFGATIYNNELFAQCTNDKQKKHLRIKLRRKLYAFFETFQNIKNDKNAMVQLKNEWQQYSKIVYSNVENIIDSNAKNEHLQLAKQFLQAMKQN
jgi:hypothetical protein